FCFFFQAEDGIRDRTVTGVQTCALPILIAPAVIRVESTRVAAGVIEHGSPFAEIDLTGEGVDRGRLSSLAEALTAAGPATRVLRSEERRVGKEARSWERAVW